MRVIAVVAVLLGLASVGFGQRAAEFPDASGTLVVREGLALPNLGRGGRTLVVSDPVVASIVRGAWSTPSAGDVVGGGGREASWRAIEANDDGFFQDTALRGGYLHVVVRSEERRVAVLDARGHRWVLVNGQPRGGDVYDLGLTALPIVLKAGDNELLFRGGRGRVRIALREPGEDLLWLRRDRTLPDVVRGRAGGVHLGLPLLNASESFRVVEVGGRIDGRDPAEGAWAAASIPPLGVRKVAVLADAGQVGGDALEVVPLARVAGGEASTAGPAASLRIRGSAERHSNTFRSAIDGSVQYYAVTPPPGDAAGTSMILTLHGASVEARNQAAAYGPKGWATIVAPTNRRPFGFDWEDWGRLDAIEVLEHAEALYGTEPARTYLTGHSMGGHGTWQVGAHFAPRFAAIGPSAGWRDFWSYGGAGTFDGDDAIGAVLNTANNASRTLLLERNYEDLGVYVLHGDADNNVPVSQARFMRERLGAFHTDFAYYEQPGAGHWWGNQCVDWPPMMRFFEERRIDLAPARERFTTMSPAISGEARLFAIHRQAVSMEPTTVELVRDTDKNTIVVTTDNVLALAIEPAAWSEFKAEPATLTIDGQTFEIALHRAQIGTARFQRTSVDQPWEGAGEFDPTLKGAHRDGPFKHAFNNRMVFVYATGGTDAENAWALAKARFDAETWQYRGNGACDVVPDTAFDLDDPAHGDRNVIVYGCADSHRLWDALVGEGPMRISRGKARVGERVVEGQGVAAFFVRPRPGSDVALVGVVAGTGEQGRRLADHSRYFISGVGYPDWLLVEPAFVEEGLAGVLGAGFFGPQWQLDWSQSGWR